MLDDLNAVALERSNPTRMIGQQTDAAKIEVEQDLSSDSNFTLYALAVLRTGEALLFTVEPQFVCASDVFKRKPQRVLMQID